MYGFFVIKTHFKPFQSKLIDVLFFQSEEASFQLTVIVEQIK